VPALSLAAITMRLFVTEGDGTPAPWDPPLKFVVSGPYWISVTLGCLRHLTY
jgi:hypothetical protein